MPAPKPPRGITKPGRDAFHQAHAQLVELDEYNAARHDEHLRILATAISDAHDARQAFDADGGNLTIRSNGKTVANPLLRIERSSLRLARDARSALGLTPARIRRLEREAREATETETAAEPFNLRLYVTETASGNRWWTDTGEPVPDDHPRVPASW